MMLLGSGPKIEIQRSQLDRDSSAAMATIRIVVILIVFFMLIFLLGLVEDRFYGHLTTKSGNCKRNLDIPPTALYDGAGE
jgi:hypothetical protein